MEYVYRPAAYMVIIEDGVVAMVGSESSCFLPGGGLLAKESPEGAVLRETREEVGRSAEVLNEIGSATQYFFSATDDRRYEMLAVFFAGRFTDLEPTTVGEHCLYWLPVPEAKQRCFHECHAWAIDRLTNLRLNSAEGSK